jgi:hypothetical protein
VTTVDDVDGESTHVAGLYTLVLSRAMSARVGAFVEVFGAVAPSAAQPSNHAVDGGITFGVRPNVQLDAAAGVGLDDVAPAWFVGLGVAVRIPR